ncbi:hypothetical protein INR49_012812 [Caranx melampygus]|nr:hypothetical protein INR49_012812 [Caranx melampygus]
MQQNLPFFHTGESVLFVILKAAPWGDIALEGRLGHSLLLPPNPDIVVMWISKCGTPLLHCATCFDMLNCLEERLSQKPAAAAAFAIFSPTLCSSIDRETTILEKEAGRCQRDISLVSFNHSSLPATQFDGCHPAVAQIPQAIMRLVNINMQFTPSHRYMFGLKIFPPPAWLFLCAPDILWTAAVGFFFPGLLLILWGLTVNGDGCIHKAVGAQGFRFGNAAVKCCIVFHLQGDSAPLGCNCRPVIAAVR